jgi:hypothetical protein
MNLVEVWFGIVKRQAIHRGVFKSVRDFNAKIRTFMDGWNDRSQPFVWTRTADRVLAKAKRRTPQVRASSSCRSRLRSLHTDR